MSDQNFPLIMSNNRQVFQALHSWMDNQPKVDFDYFHTAFELLISSARLGSHCLRRATGGGSHCFGNCQAAEIQDSPRRHGRYSRYDEHARWRAACRRRDRQSSIGTRIADCAWQHQRWNRPSKLFTEWEAACPSEVADFQRAEAEICASRDDWYQSETSHDSEANSAGEGVMCDSPGDDDILEPDRSGRPHDGGAAAVSALQELPLTGDESGQVSQHTIAAEAKVAVNPSMPLRKPSRSTPSRGNGGKRIESDRGNVPKRSSSLGCLVGPLQSGGPLASDGDPLWNSPKFVKSSSVKKLDQTEARKDEALHRRTQANAG
eukprot:g4428.t1